MFKKSKIWYSDHQTFYPILISKRVIYMDMEPGGWRNAWRFTKYNKFKPMLHAHMGIRTKIPNKINSLITYLTPQKHQKEHCVELYFGSTYSPWFGVNPFWFCGRHNFYLLCDLPRFHYLFMPLTCPWIPREHAAQIHLFVMFGPMQVFPPVIRVEFLWLRMPLLLMGRNLRCEVLLHARCKL